jgi:phage terminase large subunit-like protein
VLQLPAAREGQTRLWYDVFVPKDLASLGCVYSDTLPPHPDPAVFDDPASPHLCFRAYYGAVDTSRQGFYWPGSPSKRKEYLAVHRRQPRVAAVNYCGNMADLQGAVFRRSDFLPFIPPCDLSQGVTAPGFSAWATSLHGEVEEAWDTALGQPQSESLTVALDGLLVPCNQWHQDEDSLIVGECDFHFDVYLLDLLSEDIDFRELVLAFRRRYGLWHPRRIVVEEKQSGVSLLQTLKSTHIPIYGQAVHKGKLQRAIDPVAVPGKPIPGGAASVQGWARMGRIRIPTEASWIPGFLDKVCAFAGGDRASDEFDALVHLVTRAIVRSRSRVMLPTAGPAAASTDPMLDPETFAMAQADDRRRVLDVLAGQPLLAAQQLSPWHGMCGAPCEHYIVQDNSEFCAFHGRRTSAMNGCLQFRQKS